MGLLDFLRRRHRGEARPRLGRLMEGWEVEEWWRLLREAPRGFLVAPKVPLVLLLEETGGVQEELLSEVLPYVLVAPSGSPYAVYLREEGALRSLLQGLGLEVRLLTETGGADVAAVPLTGSAPAPESPPPVLPEAREGEASLPGEGVEEKGGEEKGGEEKGGEEKGGEDRTGGSLYADLARAWWTGQFDPKALFPAPPPPPPAGSEKGKGAGERERKEREAPREKERTEGTPACPLCGAPMVLRTARQGKRAGEQFWSCSRWPECKGARPYRPRGSAKS